MIEKHLELPTSDGAMSTFVVHPDEGGPHPVIFFYMDAPGKREELHDMARRLASVGYFVVLPNLYHRETPQYELKDRSAEAMQEMFKLMATLNRATTRVDTQAMLDFIAGDAAADADKVGALGYCMSGPFVMWAAADFPGCFKSIASIYGANLVTESPDSPHLMAPLILCDAYFACAEIDKWAPPAAVAQLEASLKAAQTPYRLEWYPKAEHGFAFPQRFCYDKPSAERHWSRLFALFKRTLQTV